MKSIHLVFAAFLSAPFLRADILSQSSAFLSTPGMEYTPEAVTPDVAVENPAYAPFSPADSDFGVQQVLGRYSGLPPVQITLDASLNYTNNAPGATRALDGESWYMGSSLGMSWRPRLAYGWFADIGLRQDVFIFDRSEATNFQNFEPYIGAVKTITELDDLLVFVRYEYQRITTQSLADSSYWGQRVRIGSRKSLLLTSHYQLSAGLNSAFDVSANQDRLERYEYGADLSFTYWFADHLSSTLSWGGSMWDFSNNSRRDWNNVLGLELTWTPCTNARIYSNIYYINHDSNSARGVNDYEALQSGIGVGLNYSF